MLKESLCALLMTLSVNISFYSYSQCPSTSVTRFLLIRHGRTDWNDQSKMQGHTDNPLNNKGIQQATAVANLIVHHNINIDAIYSSDLMRAVSTAQPIAHIFKKSIITDPILREADLGIADGMHEDDFAALYNTDIKSHAQLHPNRLDQWNYTPVPGAETKMQVLNRIEQFLHTAASKHTGHTVAVVTHGAVIKTLIHHLTEKEMHTPNCCIAEFEYNHITRSIRFIDIKKI